MKRGRFLPDLFLYGENKNVLFRQACFRVKTDLAAMTSRGNASNMALVFSNREGLLRSVTASGPENNIMKGICTAVCAGYVVAQLPHVQHMKGAVH